MEDAHVTKNLMEIFHTVRKELAAACPDLGLRVDFPIKQAKNSMRGYHGWCDVAYDGWDPTGCCASIIQVRGLNMMLREHPAQNKCPPCDKKLLTPGRILPIEILLCTFIHELTHTVTHGERKRRDEVSSAVLKLQPEAGRGHKKKKASGKEMVMVHHSQTFYKNFATLLSAAEKLGIYALPSVRNKFTARNLMRFDSIDLGMHLKGFHVGYSKRYSRRSDLLAPQTDLHIAKKVPIRVSLSGVRKGVLKCKPVLVKPVDMTVSGLLKLARAKLQLSKKQAAALWSENGLLITCDTDLREYVARADDVVLLVKSYHTCTTCKHMSKQVR